MLNESILTNKRMSIRICLITIYLPNPKYFLVRQRDDFFEYYFTKNLITHTSSDPRYQVNERNKLINVT